MLPAGVGPMAYIIAEPCIGTKDTACVDVCPVDCIHPAKGRTYDDGRPTFDEVPQLYIDPTECIDCGACVPVCPVTALFALEDLPEKWHAYIEPNKNYVDGGTFQPDKYQKASSWRLPRHYAWHQCVHSTKSFMKTFAMANCTKSSTATGCGVLPAGTVARSQMASPGFARFATTEAELFMCPGAMSAASNATRSRKNRSSMLIQRHWLTVSACSAVICTAPTARIG